MAVTVCGRRVDSVENDDRFALVAASAINFLVLSKSRLPVSAPEPALLAIGVPQVKNDGQTFQFFGSPAKALLNST